MTHLIASPHELFIPSLGPPDNYSERLLAYWVTNPGTFPRDRDWGLGGHFFRHRRRRLSSRISTFKGRDESSPVASRTAYRVIHTRSLSPARSRARGYPRHPSWKKPPGTGAGFIYSLPRDFHVNLPRTFVTFPITDWRTAIAVNRGLLYFSI